MDTRKILCDRCKRSVPVSEIRYVMKTKDQKMAVCTECRAKTGEKEMAKKVSKTGPIARPADPNKKTYFCSRCNFKFKADPIFNVKCPYCGEKDWVSESKPASADTLIAQSKEFDDEKQKW